MLRQLRQPGGILAVVLVSFAVNAVAGWWLPAQAPAVSLITVVGLFLFLRSHQPPGPGVTIFSERSGREALAIYVVTGLAGFFAGKWFLLQWLEPMYAKLGGVALAMVLVAALWRARRRRIEERLAETPGMKCTRCGYNLRYNKGRCPECGTPCIAHTGRFAEIIPAPDEVI